ncbi:MAG: ThuA domain-containing protein [Vicinamibacterales bacterium]
MNDAHTQRAHLIAGGFPPGASAGHDHDYVRLRLLALLYEAGMRGSVANDFADIDKWLPVSDLLVTYTAGPYPDEAQCDAIEAWLEAGGHWLALHGTSGGRAQRVEGLRERRFVKGRHHDVLGCRFLIHPPIRTFRVDVATIDHPLTKGVDASFEIEDEPYFVELLDPASTQVLLTADYGPGAAPAAVPTLYGGDPSLRADGRSRVLGYTREIDLGCVTYLAFGHCHDPAARADRPDVPGQASTFRSPWETEAFITLLRNAISWRARTAAD